MSTAATTAMSLASRIRVSPTRSRAWSSARTALSWGWSGTAPPWSRRSARPRGLSTDHRAVERREPARHPGQAGAGRVGAAAAVVADDQVQHLAVVADPHPGPGGAGVLDGVGQALGDREVGRRLDRRRQRPGRSTVTVTGSGIGSASASMPPASPRSASAGGWMPRTTERRSSRASTVVSRASRSSAAAASGSVAISFSARPTFMPTEAIRAWAPSCRSRSIRRTSAALWSSVSVREAATSSTRRSSCSTRAWPRMLRSASGPGADQAGRDQPPGQQQRPVEQHQQPPPDAAVEQRRRAGA